MSYHQVAGLDRYPAPFEHIVDDHRPHDRPRRQHTYHTARRPEDRGRAWHDRPLLSSSEGRQSSAPAGSGRFPEDQRVAYFITHQADPPRNEPNVLFQRDDYASSPDSAHCRHPRLVEQLFPVIHHHGPRPEEGIWEHQPPSPRSWHSASPPPLQPIYRRHEALLQTAHSQNSSPEPWIRSPHDDRSPSPNHAAFFRVRPEGTISDDEAVEQVKANIRRKRQRDSARHRKILLSLIYSPSYSKYDKQLQIDEDTLSSIFLAVNSIFFAEELSQRVTWSWSDSSSSPEYDGRIVGRTSLSELPEHEGGGYKSSITLSRPILSDRKYNRHLLISAFIHELIHCYLFTVCGFAALDHGGHTNGFKEIAKTIDDWAGPDTLHLSHMEADLKQFLDPQTQQHGNGCHHPHPAGQPVEHSFCYPPQAFHSQLAVAEPRPYNTQMQQQPQQLIILNQQPHQHHQRHQPEISRNNRWDHPDILLDQAGRNTFTNVMMTRSASDRGVPAQPRYGEMWH